MGEPENKKDLTSILELSKTNPLPIKGDSSFTEELPQEKVSTDDFPDLDSITLPETPAVGTPTGDITLANPHAEGTPVEGTPTADGLADNIPAGDTQANTAALDAPIEGVLAGGTPTESTPLEGFPTEDAALVSLNLPADPTAVSSSSADTLATPESLTEPDLNNQVSTDSSLSAIADIPQADFSTTNPISEHSTQTPNADSTSSMVLPAIDNSAVMSTAWLPPT